VGPAGATVVGRLPDEPDVDPEGVDTLEDAPLAVWPPGDVRARSLTGTVEDDGVVIVVVVTTAVVDGVEVAVVRGADVLVRAAPVRCPPDGEVAIPMAAPAPTTSRTTADAATPRKGVRARNTRI
jgi:hypothetical protein